MSCHCCEVLLGPGVLAMCTDCLPMCLHKTVTIINRYLNPHTAGPLHLFLNFPLALFSIAHTNTHTHMVSHVLRACSLYHSRSLSLRRGSHMGALSSGVERSWTLTHLDARHMSAQKIFSVAINISCRGTSRGEFQQLRKVRVSDRLVMRKIFVCLFVWGWERGEVV